MEPPPSGRRIPWARLVTILAAAILAAWGIGFLAGLVVRFFMPHSTRWNRV